MGAWGPLITAALKIVGGGVKNLFGYKEKKLDLQVMQETNDKDLQIAWWEYLKSQSSTLINQVIRPITMALILGDLFYQLLWTGTYKIITLVPAFSVGGWSIGPITNGILVAFVVLFLFPLRSVEKILLRKD